MGRGGNAYHNITAVVRRLLYCIVEQCLNLIKSCSVLGIEHIDYIVIRFRSFIILGGRIDQYRASEREILGIKFLHFNASHFLRVCPENGD